MRRTPSCSMLRLQAMCMLRCDRARLTGRCPAGREERPLFGAAMWPGPRRHLPRACSPPRNAAGWWRLCCLHGTPHAAAAPQAAVGRCVRRWHAYDCLPLAMRVGVAAAATPGDSTGLHATDAGGYAPLPSQPAIAAGLETWPAKSGGRAPRMRTRAWRSTIRTAVARLTASITTQGLDAAENRPAWTAALQCGSREPDVWNWNLHQ